MSIRRFFPLRRRRAPQLWRRSMVNKKVIVMIREADTDYVGGNISTVRSRVAQYPVDWSKGVRDWYDSNERAYFYEVTLKHPRVSSKILKLFGL